MPYAVTDAVCGHNVTVAAVREHAEEQARLADLAGYPTLVEEYETHDEYDTAPSCPRCWERIAATLTIMQRVQIAEAAEDAGVDPFHAVYAYEGVRARHPRLPGSQVVSTIIHGVIPARVKLGFTRPRWQVPDEIPEDLMRLPRVPRCRP